MTENLPAVRLNAEVLLYAERLQLRVPAPVALDEAAFQRLVAEVAVVSKQCTLVMKLLSEHFTRLFEAMVPVMERLGRELAELDLVRAEERGENGWDGSGDSFTWRAAEADELLREIDSLLE